MSEKYYLCPDCRAVLDEAEVEDNGHLCPSCGATIHPDDEIDTLPRRVCGPKEVFGEEVG